MSHKNGDLALYLFNQGTNYTSYDYLGANREDGSDIFVFRVWAPNAERVFVCGDFSDWEHGIEMQRLEGSGVWQAKISGVNIFDCYKYRIEKNGRSFFKADPYAFHTETPPRTASKIYDLSGYEWKDDFWMGERKKKYEQKGISVPLNIYELHLESWRKHSDGSLYTYREIARELAAYVKMMGYTHVELMPIMEHPFAGSWGYQVTGYYAPTSRFGEPKDFMAFVDEMHRAGIGVILDWVPAHFPKDDFGLYEFDGVPLYEYQGSDRIEHEGWGTRRFDVGRNEVECFLVSNAAFFAERYHIDGLRVDAVASMLYLDYDKKPGEWVPNVYGNNICLEAVAFFKKLNSYMKEKYPDVLMIAEESAASVQITGFENDGLGFDYKWNMGWMNDILSYCETDPLFRKYVHEKTTFSMMYAFSEKFILPISHDEVVHGKKSLLDRMPGEYNNKFAGTRAFLVYMMTHPGKKLNFMGNEIGQFAEWDYEKQVEWFLLEYESHAKLQKFFSDINNLYLERRELWEQDDTWAGFDWMMADNKDSSVLAFMRYNKSGDGLLAVVNFTPVERKGFRVGVPYEGSFSELINSDQEKYGGNGLINPKKIKSVKEEFLYDGRPYSVMFDLPPLSGIIFEAKRINKVCAKKKASPRMAKNTSRKTGSVRTNKNK